MIYLNIKSGQSQLLENTVACDINGKIMAVIAAFSIAGTITGGGLLPPELQNCQLLLKKVFWARDSAIMVDW